MGAIILIVEDDRELACLLRDGLQDDGFQVLLADDGVLGMQMLQKHHPDLVLLDVMMPRLDGWEVCRCIREISDAPIIMLTGRRDEADRSVACNWERTMAIDLSDIEYRLLTCLLDQPGCVLTQQSLLSQVWGWEYADEIGYLKVYIHRLRNKIERDPQHPSYILTERGRGCFFQLPS